jgi:uncharacterized protein YcfJ
MNRNSWIAFAILASVAAVGACSPRGGQAGQPDQTVEDENRDQMADNNRDADRNEDGERTNLPVTYTIASGTRLDLTINDELSSRKNKAGDTFTAKVYQDVRDPAGNVVIEEGSTVNGVVVAVMPAPIRRTPGTLTLALTTVETVGRTFPISATIDSVQTEHRRQPIDTRDAGKVAVGAAAGAVVGQVISKNTKGTVIGAVVGGIAGAGVAAETKDLDIVLPDDAHIMVTITSPLKIALDAEDVRDRTQKANNSENTRSY